MHVHLVAKRDVGVVFIIRSYCSTTLIFNPGLVADFKLHGSAKWILARSIPSIGALRSDQALTRPCGFQINLFLFWEYGVSISGSAKPGT